MKKRFIHISFLFAVLFALFSSCKKKETAPETPTTTSTTTTEPTHHGMIYSNQIVMLTSGTLTPFNGLSGGLFSTTNMIGDGIISGTSADAGAVSLNSTTFKKSTVGSIYYTDSTNTDFSPTYNWQVAGGSGIPAINYTYSVTLPAFTGYASLSNTINLGQSNTISLNGITGADEIQVSISASTNTSYLKTVDGSATSVTFNASDLNTLSTSTLGYLYVTCSKVSYQTFSGKTIKIKAGYQLLKSDIVIQ